MKDIAVAVSVTVTKFATPTFSDGKYRAGRIVQKIEGGANKDTCVFAVELFQNCSSSDTEEQARTVVATISNAGNDCIQYPKNSDVVEKRNSKATWLRWFHGVCDE